MNHPSEQGSPESSSLVRLLVFLGTVIERSWPPFAISRLAGDVTGRRRERRQCVSYAKTSRVAVRGIGEVSEQGGKAGELVAPDARDPRVQVGALV